MNSEKHIEIIGPWEKGFILDNLYERKYVLCKTVYGEDFIRREPTSLGKEIIRLKYKSDYTAVDRIYNLVKDDISSLYPLSSIDIIISTPWSNNKRIYQPVRELVICLSEGFGIPFSCESLSFKVEKELKGKAIFEKESLLRDNIILQKSGMREYSALLVDDIYSTGTTIKACAQTLMKDSMLKKLYVLCFCKTFG